MPQETILITGATGSTGSSLLGPLQDRGASVRAMVRSEASGERLGSAASSVAVADFDDPDALRAALDGVTRAYLVTPSSPEAEAQQIRFAELAADAGVEHLVKLSQLGADEGSPVRFLRYHAAVERRIRELGLGHTFLRPNLFFQGLLNFAPSIAGEGRFYAPIGDARVSVVERPRHRRGGGRRADRARPRRDDVHDHRPGGGHARGDRGRHRGRGRPAGRVRRTCRRRPSPGR